MDPSLMTILGMYGVSVTLVGWPLVRIIIRRQLREHMTYFMTAASFLFLNLLGTVSPNVLAYHSLAFHFVFLLLSMFLSLTYFMLDMLRPRTILPLTFALSESCLATSRVARKMARRLFWISAVCVGAVALWLTPPLFTRIDLLGRWPELVTRRVEIVLGGYFHWLSIGFFEIPLFLVILADVYRRTLRNVYQEEERRWTLMYVLFLPLAFVLSVYFLNKQYAIYLMAGVALISLAYQRRLRLNTLVLFAATSIAVLLILYMAFVGAEAKKIPPILAHRTFEVYPWAAAVTFDTFPQEEPFLLGRSMLNPSGIFDYEFFNLADIVYPQIYGETGFGSAPVPAVFESYANFGFIGMAISFLVIFWLIWSITVLSWSRSAFAFSLSVYWSLKLMLVWQGPFWFGVLDPSLVIFTGLLVLAAIPLRGRRAVQQRSTVQELPGTTLKVGDAP